MAALRSSETLLNFYQTARLHMAEDKMLLRTVAEVRTLDLTLFIALS